MATMEELEKEKLTLLSALEAERKDIKKLEKYLKDLEFQQLKETPDENWTAESFNKNFSVNLRSCVKARKVVPQTSLLNQLEQSVTSTQNIFHVSCEDLTHTTEEGLKQWKAKCSMNSKKLVFSITLACQNLDAKQVQLVKVDVEDKIQAQDLKACIDDCVKYNDIPMLIQSFDKYVMLDQARYEFIQKLKKDYNNCILMKQDKSGVVNLHLLDPTSGKLLLKIKWAIICCLDTKKLSYCFTIRSEPAGQTLRDENEDLMNNILECTELNKEMVGYWENLCDIVTSSKEKPKKKK